MLTRVTNVKLRFVFIAFVERQSVLLRTFNIFLVNSFNKSQSMGSNTLAFQIFKNTQNDHNTDWSCVVYGQATDWLSKECGLVSKDYGLVSL